MDVLQQRVEDGELLNLKVVPPTLDTVKAMNAVVESYLAKNSNTTAVYGGTAIETLLGTLDTTNKVIDYDFYAPNYQKISIELANALYDQKFKYVRRINAIHPDTFRVGAEFAKEFVADITYFPSKAFKKVPKVKINGISYINPQFLKIDLYKSITRPNFNVYRWRKSYNRLLKMEEKYPLPFHVPPLPESLPASTLKKIRTYASKRNLILTGTEAYNYYQQKVHGQTHPVEAFEFYTINASSEARKLAKALGTKYTTTKFYPFLNILPRKTAVFHKNTPIAIFYEIGYDCISKNLDNIITYHCLLCFLYAKYNIAVINQNANAKALYSFQINSLREANNTYNKTNKLTGLEPSNPFRIFQTTCTSDNPDGILLSATRRQFYQLPQAKTYKPEKEYIDPKKIKEVYSGNYLGEPIGPEEKSQITALNSFEPEILDTINDEVLRTIAD